MIFNDGTDLTVLIRPSFFANQQYIVFFRIDNAIYSVIIGKSYFGERG